MVDMYELKLYWAQTSLDGVFALQCWRSLEGIQRLHADTQQLYEYCNLMDCRLSKAFPTTATGKLRVDFVCFNLTLKKEDGGELQFNNLTFDTDTDRLATFVPEFCQEHKEKGVNQELHGEIIKQAIRDAFAAKRRLVEADKARVIDAVGEENLHLLEDIECFKVYPRNMEDFFPPPPNATTENHQIFANEASAKAHTQQQGLRSRATGNHEYGPVKDHYMF